MKTVVITGASRGIGKALAEKFLQEGWFVFGTSQDGKADWSHENLQMFPLELSNPLSIQNCVAEMETPNRKIDILINNAGTWRGNEDDPVIHMEYFRDTLEVNLVGPADFTQRMIPFLNDGAHIINISSRSGSLTNVKDSEYPDYKISKTALNMLTKVLSIRFKDQFTVSSVHPGWVKTDMGGDEAEIEPEEAAEDIYKFAITKPESGQFWYKGEKYPW